MTEAAPEGGVDDLLDRLEVVIARLAEAREPLEELVVSYEEGLELLKVADLRLERLAAAAGVPPEPPER